MEIHSKHSLSRANILIATLLLVSIGWGQKEVDNHIQLALQGDIEAAKSELNSLKDKYPNSGSVIFLEALTTLDAEDAVKLYRRIIQLHPNNPYADDAMLKIGEYLYARGLYIKAAEQLRRIPVHYPRSELVYPSIRMFLNSLLVAGDKDTARFYAKVFSRKYPKISFDLKAGRATATKGRAARANAPPKATAPTNPKPRKRLLSSRKEVARLQVGAFSSQANASKLSRQLEALNYRVKIDARTSGERNLYVVFVVGFTSRREAQAAGKLLKDNYGIDYLVIGSG